jgi:hypothetical protein
MCVTSSSPSTCLRMRSSLGPGRRAWNWLRRHPASGRGPRRPGTTPCRGPGTPPPAGHARANNQQPATSNYPHHVLGCCGPPVWIGRVLLRFCLGILLWSFDALCVFKHPSTKHLQTTQLHAWELGAPNGMDGRTGGEHEAEQLPGLLFGTTATLPADPLLP